MKWNRVRQASLPDATMAGQVTKALEQGEEKHLPGGKAQGHECGLSGLTKGKGATPQRGSLCEMSVMEQNKGYQPDGWHGVGRQSQSRVKRGPLWEGAGSQEY